MPSLFPTLRNLANAALSPVESKAVVPIAFAQYYSDLAANNVHMRARDWPIERAIADGYDRVIWVFKSVNTIGADTARLPYRIREGMDEDDPIVDDHPLYRVLNHRANPVETGKVFRKRLSAQILLSKRGAFVEVTKSNGGTIKRLDLLPPDRTEPIPDQDGGIDHFRLTRRNGGYRNLDPDKVRWFRDPHPTDPYMGVTPLESAGLSVELDHFARMYNVSFMANDGRPAGILAVRDTAGKGGDIDPAQQQRIEDKFGKGPVEAGKLTVIAGELSYVDVAARPRDMAYGATAKNAKQETLGAFGVSEVVFGHTSEQTFANSDAALFNYWTRTIPAHADILLDGLDEDSEDNLFGFFDTSGVEVLNRLKKERRAEAREEVAAGVRSIWSYAVLAGLDDEMEETPHTRALYIPSGKTPIPARAEDMEALGLAVPVDEPAAGAGAPGGALPPGGDGAPAIEPPPAATGGAGAPPAPAGLPPGGRNGNGGQQPSGAARAALEALIAGKSGEGVDPKVTVAYRVERKSDSSSDVESTPDLASVDALETAVAATLAAMAVRWCERAGARLESPKARKHTRHWTPEYERDTRYGTKALDAARAVDEDTWRAEAETAVQPLIAAAAVTAAARLLSDFAVSPPPGLTVAQWAGRAVAQTVTEAVALVGRSASNQALALVTAVNRADQGGATMREIRDAVTEHGSHMAGWAKGVAIQAATCTGNGARDDAAREAVAVTPNSEVVRVWFSRRDEKVRVTHDKRTGADGQVRGLDEPFIVGTALLMVPGDPAGPFRETANCFPADTAVGAATALGSYRSWYSGPMVTVRASGRVLTGTPNHPVLTNRGWVSLGTLNVGDNLICTRLAETDHTAAGPDRRGAPHVEDAPPLIGQVHRSLAETGATHRVPGLSVDFHGDRRDGEVDVVRADRPLRLGDDPALPEHLRQLALTEPDLSIADTRARGAADQLVLATTGPPNSLMGGASESQAFLCGQPRHADPVRLGSVAGLDPGTAEPETDRGSWDTVRSSECVHRLAGLEPGGNLIERRVREAEGSSVAGRGLTAKGEPPVGGRRVDSPRQREGFERKVAVPVVTEERIDFIRTAAQWSGHVYNLETASGIYSANGVIVHNCRCFLRHRMRRTGRWTTSPVRVVPDEKARRRTGVDRDSDGLIYEGTPRERPAESPLRDILAGEDRFWRSGYDTTYDRMKDEDTAAQRQAVRDMVEMHRQFDTDSEPGKTVAGAISALDDLLQGNPKQPPLVVGPRTRR